VTAAVRRVSVVGPTGSGKSTVAAAIARRFELPLSHLDRLRYSGDWSPIPDEELRHIVTGLVGHDEWVIDGNYASVRDLVWGRVQLVVWLDLPRRVTMTRLLRRTLRRLVRANDEGEDPPESWRRVLSTQSPLLWAFRTHAALRREYEHATEIYSPRGTHVIRLRSTGAVSRWLKALDTGQLQ
jgi:adenylate kinase family enzyme